MKSEDELRDERRLMELESEDGTINPAFTFRATRFARSECLRSFENPDDLKKGPTSEVSSGILESQFWTFCP